MPPNMRTHSTVVAGLAATLMLFTACGEDDAAAYDDTWGDDDQLASGKTDSLLDEAPMLELGDTGEGYVEGKQLDVFALELKRGDEIRIVESVTQGNLSTHFTLYYGAANKVNSTSYTATPKKLTKNYRLTDSGRYYVVVKPYQERGQGRFTLKPTCTGGTCAGEPLPVEELDMASLDFCVERARSCAFADLESYAGAVGPARARTIFQTCLADAVTEDHAPCTLACDGEGSKEICEDIIGSLPFYADQSDECLRTVEECMEACNTAGGDLEWDAEEFSSTPVAICWTHGLNGTCDAFARDTEECGGRLERGSNDRCHEECESTTGAWLDDLDTLCVEACDE